jgi:hypothetical protein
MGILETLIEKIARMLFPTNLKLLHNKLLILVAHFPKKDFY